MESDPLLVGTDCVGTLRVRITTDETGPTADVGPMYNRGIYDYLRYLNESEGGIRGCPIDIDVKDTSYDLAKTEEAVEAWRQQPEWDEVSTLFIHGTGPSTRVAPRLMEEHKILISGSYAGSLATPVSISKDVPYPEVNAAGDTIEVSEHKTSPGYPYLFFPGTDYSTGIRIGVQAAWKIAPGRMAMVHDSSVRCLFCVDPIAAGKSYLTQLPSMELAEDLIVPQTSQSSDEQAIVDAVKAYIQKEIDKKIANPSYVPVSWLWTGNTLFSSSLVGKGAAAAQRLINEAFPDPSARWPLRVMANGLGIGETTPEICGPACTQIAYYGILPVPRYGDVQLSSGMIQMMKIHDEYRRKDNESIELYRDVTYINGYAAALMWRHAVEVAIDSGHNSPTGTDLKNALESFKDVDLDGMTAGPVSFSPTDHRPESSEAVYKVNGQGNLEFVDRYSVKLEPEWLGY